MTALDPGDFAYDDEARHADTDGGVLVEDPPDCVHPPAARRLEDGQQVCRVCGEVVEGGSQTIVPKDRPGSVDPTMREGGRSSGGLRHVTWDPTNPAASRPYTAEEVELELVDTLDRIERGAGWLTTKEEERSAAKIRYELDFARARFTSHAKTVAEREDDATIRCAQAYEEWQLLELQTRTAKEGLHNLRSKAVALMSIMKSINVAMSGGGGFR